MGIDIVFGVIAVFLCWRAYGHGFARQLIQLTGLALGVCLAEPTAARVAPWASQHIKAIPSAIQGPVIVLGSMFLIWFVTSTIGSLMLATYRRSVYGDNLPSLGDRLFGVAIGAVKAAFLVSLIVFGFDQLPESVRTTSVVVEQTSKSRGVKLAHDYRMVERLVGTQEVQSIGKRMQQLVEYFREPKDEATEKDGMPKLPANADDAKKLLDRAIEKLSARPD
jgi:uncharacterized membrane protein required for colicin V production